MSTEVYVARQPIFTKSLQVYAYELLFRVGKENVFNNTDGDIATSNVITNSFMLIGIDTLARGRKAFINFTKNLLIDETATILPKELLVVEILENVAPSKGIISACRKLKDLGYVLALDDFVFRPEYKPLIKLASIIKVDFLISDVDERRKVIKKFGSPKTRFLAEKVETREDFEQARDMGYALFQGYFFSKPEIVSGKDIPGSKINYLNILREINLPEADFNNIEQIIKHDVSISYKLLKFINSAFFGFDKRVESIKQAVVILGLRELKKWISLILLRTLGQDKSDELVVSSVLRARFCEEIAGDIGLKDQSQELFFLGLFSMIDTLIGMPMENILEKLPLSRETKNALLGNSGPYTDIYALMLAYEKGNWQIVSHDAKAVGINLAKLQEKYLNSIKWSNQFLSI